MSIFCNEFDLITIAKVAATIFFITTGREPLLNVSNRSCVNDFLGKYEVEIGAFTISTDNL